MDEQKSRNKSYELVTSKYNKLSYELSRLLNALRMESDLKSWTRYEIKRCEKILEIQNNKKQDEEKARTNYQGDKNHVNSRRMERLP